MNGEVRDQMEHGAAPDVEGQMASPGWRAAIRGAAAIVRDRPGLIAFGLLGFLARGGAVLFVLPIVVLPTPTGLSNFIGSQALTAGGPSLGLIWLLATALTGVAALILFGTVIGAVVDLRLLGEAMEFEAAGEDGNPPASPPRATPVLLLRATLVRVLWMLPVAIASVWGAARLVNAAYQQLILPDDLAIPLAIRVLRDAADAAAVVVVTWLLCEMFGGLAVRRLFLSSASIVAALGWGFVALVRRPLTTLTTLVAGTIGLVVAVAAPVFLANVFWRRLQVLLDGDQSAMLILITTAAFVAVWGIGLLLVGWIATWRSLTWSLEVVRASRRAAIRARTRRSGGAADRSSRDEPLTAGGGAG